MKDDNCIFCKLANGDIAGQTVRDFHLHLIPRYDDDKQNINWVPQEPSQEELENIRKTICGE